MNAVRNNTMKRIMLVVVIIMIGLTTRVTLTGTLALETVLKAYKSGERTCKQIEREYKNMKGQHELMFKSWQEKSIPLLTEDKEILTPCQDTILTFKNISEKIEEINHNRLSSEEDKQTDLIVEYEKVRNMMQLITSRHKSLREKHEEIFHNMMGH